MPDKSTRAELWVVYKILKRHKYKALWPNITKAALRRKVDRIRAHRATPNRKNLPVARIQWQIDLQSPAWRVRPTFFDKLPEVILDRIWVIKYHSEMADTEEWNLYCDRCYHCGVHRNQVCRWDRALANRSARPPMYLPFNNLIYAGYDKLIYEY